MNERAAATAGHELLSVQLIRAVHEVDTRLDAALEPLGLSLAKLGLLSQLVAAGEPLPLGTLAERQACVRSNITQLIDRLEADRLVARVDDPRDRRSILAELTPEGRARQAAGMRAVRQAERDLFSDLPQHQRDIVLKFLDSLRPTR